MNDIGHLSGCGPGPERLVNQPTRALEAAVDEMYRLERGHRMRSVGEGGRHKQTFKQMCELPKETKLGKRPGNPFCGKTRALATRSKKFWLPVYSRLLLPRNHLAIHWQIIHPHSP